MAFSTTVSADYKVSAHDAPESVTLRHRAADGSYTSTSITFAESHEITVNEAAASGGLWVVSDIKWVLPAAQVSNSNRPVPGDAIVDASSVEYEILDAVLDDLGIAWTCTTRKAR